MNMNIRIYQSYYKPEQLKKLDPAFVPWDNTQNFLPELREYPILQQVRHRCVLDHVDLFGMFSWKFTDKMKMSGDQVLQHIRDNPGYDAYFFNPFSYDLGFIYNTWEHAEWCHPGMISILEHVFYDIGLDPDSLREPMAINHMTWCNFIVANQGFWDKWLTLVNDYMSVIRYLPHSLRQLHDGNCGYGLDQLTFMPFIIERMASALAHSRPDLRISTVHGTATGTSPKNITKLRERAMCSNTPEDWKSWLDLRDPMLSIQRNAYPNVTDLARSWVDVAEKQQIVFED